MSAALAGLGRSFFGAGCVWVAVLGLAGVSTARAAVEFWVAPGGNDAAAGTLAAPLATLEGARQRVAALRADMADDIIVYLRGGEYRLDAPVVFGAGDSGSNRRHILYRNHPGEEPVIHSAVAVTGWTETAPGSGLFRAGVGGARFRQMFRDTGWAVRARHPNLGEPLPQYAASGVDTKGFLIHSADVPAGADLRALELVTMNYWMEYRGFVTNIAVSGATATAEMENRSYPREFHTHRTYFWENDPAFVDSDGEWFLDFDTGEVTVRSGDGGAPAGGEFTYPALETLVRIDGASDLYFFGITFARTGCLDPSTARDYYQRCGGMRWPRPGENGGASKPQIPMPGAVEIRDARNIRFERCRFRQTGANGVLVREATRRLEFEGNVFADVGDSGIVFSMQNPFPGEDGNSETLIRNNLFTRLGRVSEGGYGMHSYFPNRFLILRNEFSGYGSWGINLGEENEEQRCVVGSNEVAANLFRDLISRSTDASGIHIKNDPLDEVHTLIQSNWFDGLVWDGTTTPRPHCGIFRDNKCNRTIITRNVYDRLGPDGNGGGYTGDLSGDGWNGMSTVPVHDNDIRSLNQRFDDDVEDQAVRAGAGLAAEFAGIKALTVSGATGTGNPAGYYYASLWEAPVPSGLPFVDDFEDGDFEGWTIGEGGSVWSVLDFLGSRRLRAQDTAATSKILLSNRKDWTNATVEASIICSTDQPDDFASILLRARDANHFYMAMLGFGTDDVRLYRRSGGSYTLLATAAVGGGLGSNTVYRAGLAAAGSNLTVTVNGSVLIEHADSVHAGGGVGVRSYGAVQFFDDVRVFGDDFEAFQTEAFPPVMVNDPARRGDVWGEQADYDGDGLATILEYALGGDPLRAGEAGVRLGWGGAGADLLLTFPRSARSAGMGETVWFSRNLADWSQWLVGAGDRWTEPLPDGRERVTLRLVGAGGGSGFFRLGFAR